MTAKITVKASETKFIISGTGMMMMVMVTTTCRPRMCLCCNRHARCACKTNKTSKKSKSDLSWEEVEGEGERGRVIGASESTVFISKSRGHAWTNVVTTWKCDPIPSRTRLCVRPVGDFLLFNILCRQKSFGWDYLKRPPPPLLVCIRMQTYHVRTLKIL